MRSVSTLHADDRKPAFLRVKERLIAAGVAHAANDSIAGHVSAEELKDIEAEVAERVEHVLDALVIERDHNTADTARRVARMYVGEVFAGRYIERPTATSFPNARKLDEMATIGPIAVRSSCSHHLCPVEGDLWCGFIPGERVIGLSKFSRLAQWVMARPQIQEEAIVQLADLLEEEIKPRGLAVVMKARHTCMTWRGVREHATTMTTDVMRGIFRDGPAARAEFFSSIAAQGFACR